MSDYWLQARQTEALQDQARSLKALAQAQQEIADLKAQLFREQFLNQHGYYPDERKPTQSNDIFDPQDTGSKSYDLPWIKTR